MTKPRPLKIGAGNHWKLADDERLREAMRANNGLTPGKGRRVNFWGPIAVKLGLEPTAAASRRVRRRWVILAPDASNEKQVANLQLEHANAVCGADAGARDVLELLALLDDRNVSTFIDQALSASRGADVDALEKELVALNTEDAILM